MDNPEKLATSFTPSPFIEVLLPNQENWQSCIHVFICIYIDFVCVSTIFRMDFGTVSTVYNCFRKIPVLRLNFPRLSAREIFRLLTGIFRKYPSQAGEG
jgi:hypothetical protein